MKISCSFDLFIEITSLLLVKEISILTFLAFVRITSVTFLFFTYFP